MLVQLPVWAYEVHVFSSFPLRELQECQDVDAKYDTIAIWSGLHCFTISITVNETALRQRYV